MAPEVESTSAAAPRRPAPSSLRRLVAVGVVSLLSAWSAGAAGAVTPPRELVLSASRLQPGETLEVTGRGFVLPEPDGCEVVWDGPPPRSTDCGLDGVVFASITIGRLAEGPAVHTALVCVPTCEHPWAGSRSVPVTVDGGGEPAPDVDPDPGPGRLDDILPDLLPQELVPVPRSSPAPPTVDLVLSRSRPAAPAPAVVPPPPPGPGDVVPIVVRSLPGDPALSTGCELTLDDVPTGECTADGTGSLTGLLVVPADAAAGERRVAACRPVCEDAVGGREVRPLLVLAPEPTGTDEPTAEPESPTVTEPQTEAPTEEPTGAPTGAPTATVQPTATPTQTGEPTPEGTTLDSQATGATWPAPQGWLLLLGLTAAAVVVGTAVSSAQSRRPAHGGAPPTLHPWPDTSPEVRIQVLRGRPRGPTLGLRSRPDPEPTTTTEVDDDHAG